MSNRDIKRRMIRAAALMMLALAAACAAREGKAPDWDINAPVTRDYTETGTAFDGRVQVIAFNIERGLFWPDVVKYIEARRAEVPATIVLLGECDRNHSRTGDVFVADQIARALGMDLVFATEYVEYNDETPENQGDHGNAILSPFPLENITVIRHTTIYSWQKYGWKDGQPRYGERVTIGADAVLPDGRRVRVYATHLESNAETVGKWIQMREIISDLRGHDGPAIIGGDFNELPAGLMFELFPAYGIKNAFGGDLSPTGGCRPGEGRARCLIKIDWIVSKGLTRTERAVDYPLNVQGGVISDHAPVRAVFTLP